MVKKNIRFLTLILCSLYIVCLCSCGKAVRTDLPKYSVVTANTENDINVENDKYSLVWNKEVNSPVLIDKASGKHYYTAAPISEVGEKDETLLYRSAITINYATQLSLNYKTAYSANSKSCIIKAEKTDFGIKVVYDFTECKIQVPVNYLLSDSGLKIDIDVNAVAEGSKNMLYSIYVAPAMNRLINKSDNGYFLIPSGSGALVYPNVGLTRKYYEPVYGIDMANRIEDDPTKDEVIRMPVYGTKDGNTAIFSILENGAENAVLNISLNEPEKIYSSCYANFSVRGREKVSNSVAGTKIETYYYDEEIANTRISLNCYFLNEKDADYSGMASVYREYIENKYGKSDVNFSKASSYMIKLLGGVEYKKFAFGIPYTSLYSLTTLSNADDIISEISKESDTVPVVQLMGYGNSGLDNGKLAGGYNIASKLGSFSKLTDMQKEYSKKGGEIFLDFDLVNFSESSNGFSAGSDAVETVSGNKSRIYYKNIALTGGNKGFKPYFLLSRGKIQNAADKLVTKIEKSGISAVSLSTLGNLAYSDTDNRDYIAKSGMSNTYLSSIKGLKDKGKLIAVNSGNEYAVATSNYSFDAPIGTSKYDFFGDEIPFYQMVFGNRTVLYNTSVNLNSEPKTAILKSAESGSGLSFTLLKNYNTELINTTQSVLYSCVYSGLKDDVINTVKSYNSYYESIKGSKIVKHSIENNGIRKTVFENGTTVYTNYSDKNAIVDDVTVEAESFTVKRVN